MLILPQDQSHLDFLWPHDSPDATDANRANGTAGAGAAAATHPSPPPPLAPTPRPPDHPTLAPTPATGRVAPPSRRRRVIGVTPVLDAANSETRTCANCGTACVEEYCACGMRVRRSPHHPRPRWDAGAPPEASVTPAATSRRHDDIPIHLTDSASQFRMDIDCDDAPFELTLPLPATTLACSHWRTHMRRPPTPTRRMTLAMTRWGSMIPQPPCLTSPSSQHRIYVFESRYLNSGPAVTLPWGAADG